MQPRSPAEQPWAQGERKVALIMGITGQDGSYLAELLLAKGYEVHGSMRRASSFSTGYIEHLHGDAVLETAFRVHLHYSDLTDGSSLVRLLSSVQPTEVYNLGAQSHVKVSFELSVYTAEVDGMGTLRLLDAIRACKLEKKTRLYQASTSELFGRVQQRPQRESTPFHPHSPYGVAKLYAYWMIVNYREAYGMYSCNGILFNHESPRRGETFVTRKISRGVAKISLGQQELIELGNIDSQRDWGHARDYVEAMWLMLQQPEPEDFVIATGEVHSVRKFVEKAFAHVGVAITWEGKGADEVGKDSSTGVVRVRINPKFYRPTEVEFLQGDASKAKRLLGWVPKTSFDDLVKEMMDADLELFRKNRFA